MRTLDLLWTDSIPATIVRRLQLRIAILTDDIAPLRHDPLGMFLYNLRAIVFLAAAILITCLATISLFVRSVVTYRTTAVLATAWACAILLTLLLQNSFRRSLSTWVAAPLPTPLPPLFYPYFLLDYSLLLAVVLVGRRMGARVDAFAFLLLASTTIYAAYVAGRTDRRVISTLVVVGSTGFATAIIVLMPPPRSYDWVTRFLDITPIIGTIIVVTTTISIVGWLRRRDQQQIDERLAALAQYAQSLTAPNAVCSKDGEHSLRHSVRPVLEDLCDRRRDSFWYRSACVWISCTHQERGDILAPAAYANAPELREFVHGIPTAEDFLQFDDLQLVYSLAAQRHSKEKWRLRTAESVPAAAIPLRRGDTALGILTLYGDSTSAVSLHHDLHFLYTLGSILAAAVERWAADSQRAAVERIDASFGRRGNLGAGLRAVVPEIQKQLHAAGCMILLRDQSSTEDMRVIAFAGLNAEVRYAELGTSDGLLRRAATEGTVIRIDAVDAHRDAFDEATLAYLERMHGKPIRSLLIIPIGLAPRNHGVVALINSTAAIPWFTERDVALGSVISIRLQLAIERAVDLAEMHVAVYDANQTASQARQALRYAEDTALRRMQDLMIITHQLQGPLIALHVALSSIADRHLDQYTRNLLEYSTAILDDATELTHGLFTTFAFAAGRPAAFAPSSVNARAETKRLAMRLRGTNAREDITFEFREAEDFPTLQVDRLVFASVMHTLIHNAMKYADPHSRVVLECGQEGSDRHPAVKVKSIGPPIMPHERERIFEQFCRGTSVEHGRAYSGVGLGLWVARQLMGAIRGEITLELAPDHPRLSVFVTHWPVPST